MAMLDELKTLLQRSGADMVEVADLNEVPPDARYGFPFSISIAVALNPQIIAAIKDGPTKQYHAEYERVNKLLNMIGHHAVQFLEEHGHKAEWFPATSYDIDPKTLSTILPHKTTATRAGLGWIGKCALLVTKTYGSAVRITTVLTDAPLPVSESVDASLCGECTYCVDACPGHALSGTNWRKGLYRDALYDAFACQKTARELTMQRVGIKNTLCGICIAACPWTQKYVEKYVDK